MEGVMVFRRYAKPFSDDDDRQRQGEVGHTLHAAVGLNLGEEFIHDVLDTWL
jgi:hypothetical protein